MTTTTPALNIKENVHEYTVLTILGEAIFHREDGPAYIYFWENGEKKLEIWYKTGLRHREDGPAVIEYYENGKVKEKQWYIEDAQHRTDGPAWICYDEEENIKTEYYFQNNLLFREDNLLTIVNY
jgi:hypothetical protein